MKKFLLRKMKGNANADSPKPCDFEHIPAFKTFMGKQSGDVNKVNLFKQRKKAGKRKRSSR